MPRLFGRSFVAVVCLAVAACGPKGPQTYPVQGKVVYMDGSPVTGGIVEFESAQPVGKQKVNARGDIQSDGAFTLKTQEREGAVAGSHRVVVVPLPGDSKATDKTPPKELIHKKYRSYDDSGLTVEIKEGPDNAVTLKVEKP